MRNVALMHREDWSEDVKELAYTLYAGECGRKVRTLEHVLADEPYEYVIPYGTLHSWKNAGEWDARANAEADRLVPSKTLQIHHMAQNAAVYAMQYIVGATSGALPAEKERTAVAKLALEAAGIIGSGRRDTGVVVNVAALSDASGGRVLLTAEQREQLSASVAGILDTTSTDV